MTPLLHALVRRVALADSVEAEMVGDLDSAAHLRAVELTAREHSTEAARFAAARYLDGQWCSTLAEAEALAEEAA